jgi:hypothetical protein
MILDVPSKLKASGPGLQGNRMNGTNHKEQ